MKKIILLVLLFCANRGFAQEDIDYNARFPYKQGLSIISIGTGLPGRDLFFDNLYRDELRFKIVDVKGPLFIKYEYAATDESGVALQFAYRESDFTYDKEHNNNSGTSEIYIHKIKRIDYSIILRFNYHFQVSEKLDPYFGLGTGYRVVEWEFKSNDPYYRDIVDDVFNPNPFALEFTGGIRYFFSKNIGIYTEIGIAKSPLQFGINIKF